ncbi:hypothetical protein BJ944DRAFT_271404 [Cunninghamella echinulata]|nr:hypothetical protein BJ944DRAFT_271404 [Cunninghamella echinulata]
MLNNSNSTSPYEEESDNGDKYTDSTLKTPTETTYNQSKYNTNSTANSKYARSAYNNNNNNNYNNSSTSNTSNSKYARSAYNNNSNDNKYPYKNKYDKYNNNENSKYSRSSYNNNDSNNQFNNHSNSKYSPSNSTEPRSYNKYSNQYSNYNNNSNKSRYDQRKTSYTNNNQHEQQPSQTKVTKETDSIDELSQGISSLSTNDDKHLITKPANTYDEDDQVKVIECKGLSIEEVDDIFNKYESMRGGYGVKSMNEEQILIVFGHTSTGSRAWQENKNNNKIQVFKGSMDLVKDVIPMRKSAMSQKPTSSNMVARRLIHGALGMKAPIRTEAQKKADQKLLDTARSERNAKREN